MSLYKKWFEMISGPSLVEAAQPAQIASQQRLPLYPNSDLLEWVMRPSCHYPKWAPPRPMIAEDIGLGSARPIKCTMMYITDGKRWDIFKQPVMVRGDL